MKKLTQIGLLLALILGFASESQAALLIEPVVGYNVGKSTVKLTGEDSDDSNFSGASYGGRLGFQKLGFQIGADFLASSLTQSDAKIKTTEWGGFVGFEFPILLRVYAGYIFSGTAKLDQDDLTDKVNLTGGTGPKIGVGFTLLPFLDLNLEYRRVTYGQKEDVMAGKDLDAKYEAIMFGVSLPFTI